MVGEKQQLEEERGEIRPWELLWWHQNGTEIDCPKPEQNSAKVLYCSKPPAWPSPACSSDMLSLRRAWIIGGMFLTGGNGSTGRKTYPGANFVHNKSHMDWAGTKPGSVR
jgi:hypothetical protein